MLKWLSKLLYVNIMTFSVFLDLPDCTVEHRSLWKPIGTKLFLHLPNTWEEPAKQKCAVALDEGGEEGEDTVDGERDEERLSTAYPVSQSSPEERPDHHPKIYNQTWGMNKWN